jgi:carbon monoxide dehydrogenase subunit G
MPVLREHIETSLGIEETFAFVADFANASRWDPGVATSERLDPTPVGVGSRYRLGVRIRGRVAPMEYRISRLEPPHRVVLKGQGAGVCAVDDIRFVPSGPDGSGTRIDYTADIRLRGAARLLSPFLGGTFARIARDAASGLQRALEGRRA